MKKLLSVITLSIVLISCGEHNKKPEKKKQKKPTTSATSFKPLIQGSVEGLDSGTVILEENSTGRVNAIGRSDIDNAGNFSISTSIPKEQYFRLNIANKYFAYLYKDFDTITLNVVDGLIKIDGSQESKIYTEAAQLTQIYTTQIDSIRQVMANLDDYQNPLGKALFFEQRRLEAERDEELRNYLLKNSPSRSALAISSDFLNSTEPMDDFFKELLVKYENVDYYPDIINQIKDKVKISIGNLAPDFEITNPEGKTIKLSDLRGQVVLLDFWASWCKPCMLELPNVKRNYRKYKDQDFEVLGVSIDQSEEAWTKTIASQNMDWTHGWDSKGKISRQYGVRGIPFTLLIDKDGKIIDKNLRGEELGMRLEEIF